MAKRVRKKHNPIKRYQRFGATKLKGTLIGYMVNEDKYTDLLTLKGKRIPLTKDMVNLIEQVPYKWHTVCVTICKSEVGEKYIKMQEVVAQAPYYKRDLVQVCNDIHYALVNQTNKNHMITAGWLSSPLPIEYTNDMVFDIFTELGAFKFLAKWEHDQNQKEDKDG